MKHIVVDNIVPKSFQDNYELACQNFNWNYLISTYKGINPNPQETEEIYDVGQLVYPIHFKDYTTDFYSKLDPLISAISKIKPLYKDLLKIKSNLLWRTRDSNNRWNTPHTDIDSVANKDDIFWSCVYYINDSDGDTCLFYENEVIRVSPKKGRAVLFPSSLLHAGSNPTVSQQRVVFNIVWKTTHD
jgi:hypothetical protein